MARRPGCSPSDDADADDLRYYARLIHDIPVLTNEEEQRLAKVKNRKTPAGQAAFDKLYRHNLRLALYFANRYPERRDLTMMDVVSSANLGLRRAVEKFTPGRSRFSTYATFWIRQAIMRAIQNEGGLIRTPVHVQRAARKASIDRAKGIEPTMTGFYPNGCKVQPDTIRCAIEAMKRPASFEVWRSEDGENVFSEVFHDGDAEAMKAIQEKENSDRVAKLLKTLPDRHRAVITMRYGLLTGEEMTLEQIAQTFRPRLSRERVRQIQEEAESLMKGAANGHGTTKRRLSEKSYTHKLRRPARLASQEDPRPGLRRSPALVHKRVAGSRSHSRRAC